MLGCVAVALVIFFRLMPYGYRSYNFVPAGAMFLFFGCRLRPGIRYLLPFATMAGIDLLLFDSKSWNIPFWSYISHILWSYAGYMLYLLFGWLMLRHSESIFRIPAVAIAGSLQFFLITNFGVWLGHAIHLSNMSAGPVRYTLPTSPD